MYVKGKRVPGDKMSKLKFLVSLTTNDNDYQAEQAASAEQASRKLGVDVAIVYADNDAINQSTQILKAIQDAPEDRPDGIIFEPVGGTALPQVARAAASAGIGWAVLNRDANYIAELRRSSKAPIFAVSADHVEIGRIQGKQCAALLPTGGSVLYIQGPSENSAAKERAARNAGGETGEYPSDDLEGTVDGGKFATCGPILAKAVDFAESSDRSGGRAGRFDGDGSAESASGDNHG